MNAACLFPTKKKLTFVLELAAGSGRQGILGAGIGFCIGAPRHYLTLALALAADSGRHGIILPGCWNWLLPQCAKV